MILPMMSEHNLLAPLSHAKWDGAVLWLVIWFFAGELQCQINDQTSS